MQNVWDQMSCKKLAATATKSNSFKTCLVWPETTPRPKLVSTMFMLQFLWPKEPEHTNEMQCRASADVALEDSRVIQTQGLQRAACGSSFGNIRYLNYTIALNRTEQRLKRPSCAFFVLNIIFNHSQRLSRSLNCKSNFLFCNF